MNLRSIKKYAIMGLLNLERRNDIGKDLLRIGEVEKLNNLYRYTLHMDTAASLLLVGPQTDRTTR
ncbi:hypothetical protein [Chryseomicrobium excrementi]|uniref:hypothetical protein n=1 Tax=Chryseomicrobium excrementi TaxID=2041346 RepID=UPI0013FDA58A|nr:hypothetical protein [Chryseomicrobium excrementi]